MSIRRLALYALMVFVFLALAGIPTRSASPVAALGQEELVAGRNVNMVSGTKLPLGDPWVQRQNEPSGVASWRNPMHIFAAANDYRTVDVPDQFEVRGIPGVSAARDAWIGTFYSLNGGESFYTMLLPGFPQDATPEGVASPIHGFDTACDPKVGAGSDGRLYLSGIAFNRSQNAGVVFVARYIDYNDRERVDIETIAGQKRYVGPIRYWDTNIALAGNPGQFIDMPNMAVDIPRADSEIGNVYLACTVFLGNTDINVRSKVVFLRSIDGGVTWSKEIKLTESQHIIQRPVIAIDPSDPTGKTIYVVLRRFAHLNTPGGIVFFKSIDGGLSFTKPADVATLLYPFDQWTKGEMGITSPRTNSYPSITVDENGFPWVVWAQRYDQYGMGSPDGQSKIVFSYSTNGGITWEPPQWVDPSFSGPGHEFMPSITCAGGIKTVIWYDQRNDIALNDPLKPHEPYAKFIEDVWGDHRHTVDVRAAETLPGEMAFNPSMQVSRYLYFLTLDEYGEPYLDQAGFPLLWQGEFDYSGLPLFWMGTRPFHGDYIQVASSPQVLPPVTSQYAQSSQSDSWTFNTDPTEPTISHGFWTDTRDVWPPNGSLWGDWINYNPPFSDQDVDFQTDENGCLNEDTTGMRNQNVYSATLNRGVIVGSPWNTKKLDIQRTFVLFVKDTLGVIDPDSPQNRNFQLKLDDVGSNIASFEQLADVDTLDIVVPPYSSVSCTVYAGPWAANDGFAPIIVNVYEGDGGPLVGRVYLNPDSTTPYDPDTGLPLGDEFHTPLISNPKVWKYDVGNQKEPNASFLSPRAQNPRAQNSGYVNPRAQNPRAQNPRAQNPRAQNPRAQNENIINHELYNPRAQNTSVVNTSLTDMTWTVTNAGNTTSAYTFNLTSTMADYFNMDPPPLIGQILVYKVHSVPIDNGCALAETRVDELLVNVTNPRAQNPRAQNITPTSGRFTSLAMGDATEDLNEQDVTFYLAPGEQAEVTLRVYDPDINDQIAFDTTVVAGETVAEAPNTGDTEPEYAEQPNIPWENPLPAIVVYPISLSFNTETSATRSLNLSLSGLGVGESLEYTLSVDLRDGQNWLSVLPTGGTLDGIPLAHAVTVTAPSTSGSYSGSIWVHVPGASNNPLRVPVYLTVGATAVPEIDVSYTYAGGPDTPIIDGGTFDFGVENLGSSSEEAIFEVENIGDLDLTLGGKPIITIYGPDASQFRVVQQPGTSVVAPDASTTFRLQFAPTSVGPKTAHISIMNNDLDENPFDIALQGTCEATSAQLVAYYPFNGNAGDASGHGNDGIVNGATLTSDRFGNPDSAYLFDGLDDGIVVADSATLDITHAITMTAWIKPDPGRASGEYVVQKRELTQGGSVYTLDIWPGTVRSLYRYEGGGTATRYATGSTDIAEDQWQQVAATWDGSTITVYLNGQSDGTASFTDGPIQTSTGQLEIGHYTGGWRYFSGCIDDVRIYNGALSPTEIQQLYEQESAPPLGPVAYYPFNGNANDESGNGNDGTVTGATLTQDRFGNPSSAYSFDGVDDGIVIPNSPSLSVQNFQSGYTITAWVKLMAAPTLYGEIIDKGQDCFCIRTVDDQRLEACHSSSEGVYCQTRGFYFVIDEWAFVAATWDAATGDWQMYFDGVPGYSSTMTSLLPYGPSDSTVTIGRRSWYDEWNFNGVIDDVRIYNRGLSPSEIQEIYNSEAPPPQFETKWGSYGIGEGEFDNPADLAVDSSGNVYVADTRNDRIQKFTSDGTFLTEWGGAGEGDGQFYSPYGIAVDNSGNVYVVDQGNCRVQKFTSNGTFLAKWGSSGPGDGQFIFPAYIAADSSGNVYVTEWDYSIMRIQKFTSNGTFLTKWGSYGSEDDQFEQPNGIGVDSSGNVYVVDCGNSRIQKYTSDGNFLTKWGSFGTGDSQLYFPYAIGFDSSGNVYVTNVGNDQIKKFTPDGNFLAKWGSSGTGDGQFNWPGGIAIDSSGNVYVVDADNHRIQKFH